MVVSVGLGTAEQLTNIAKRAGREIMRIYERGFTAEEKADRSPVTEADRVAEGLIVRAIGEGITAAWPIVAEEAMSKGDAPNIKGTPFWLIDPLDGTKEFISGNGEFTVNIALIENGLPIFGVVHAPAIDITYVGFKEGVFSQKGDETGQPIKVRQPPAAGLTAVVSRSHSTPEVDAFLGEYKIAETISSGSSLKFCRIADGSADIYPRFGRTMEWDTAAGHAVLNYAGGKIVTTDGGRLVYGKAGFENPHFIARTPGCDDFRKDGSDKS